jgi:hypothetical protein
MKFYETLEQLNTLDPACRTVNGFKRVARNILRMKEYNPPVRIKTFLSYLLFWVNPERFNSDAGVSPKRKTTPFRTLRSFGNKNKNIVLHVRVELAFQMLFTR